MALMVLYWLLVILACLGYIPAVNEKFGVFGRGIDLVLFIILGLKVFGIPS